MRQARDLGGTVRAVSGGAIKSRRASLGWSQKRLADEAGTSQQTVDRIERGEVEHSRAMVSIMRALAMWIPEDEADSDRDRQESAYAEKRRLYSEATQLIPVYMETGPRSPMQYTPRPFQLLNVPDAYAVLVTRSVMRPSYKPKDKVYVDPNYPISDGDDVVLVGPEETTNTWALGTYVGETDTTWMINTLSPAATASVLKADWPSCHLIIGKMIPR